jgi:hypothetical protein
MAAMALTSAADDILPLIGGGMENGGGARDVGGAVGHKNLLTHEKKLRERDKNSRGRRGTFPVGGSTSGLDTICRGRKVFSK